MENLVAENELKQEAPDFNIYDLNLKLKVVTQNKKDILDTILPNFEDDKIHIDKIEVEQSNLADKDSLVLITQAKPPKTLEGELKETIKNSNGGFL
nr:hypothetical protein [Methanobrevibacter arboriphilus]